MRSGIAKLVLAALCCGVAAAPLFAAQDQDQWVDSWACAPDTADTPVQNQTVREVVRLSVGGSKVRVQLSNLLGKVPLTLGSVHIALHASGADIVSGTDHALLFHGQAKVTIAPGGSVWSDPAAIEVKPLQELAVSIYVPATDVLSTSHRAGIATTYVNESGDATATLHFPADENSNSRFLLTDIAVSGPAARETLVTFGDSITDGTGSLPDANQRWPDYLAARLHADAPRTAIGIANAGISGNRILHDGYGPSALARFDRDALSKPGVHWIVLLEGINDIGASGYAAAQDKVSAAQLIAGMQTLIARAHARHLKIFGATLTPYGGNNWPYHTAAGEQVREAVNHWIRTAGAFDGVVDFDRAVRDPAHPERMLATYDSGDHLHPNGAGYQAMANAVDLNLFKD